MKKRKDSFWGIHCDFHARPWMSPIGRHLCEEDIRKVCRELRPDFWQIDCKGHFGWASYPSELPNAIPEFAFDTLALFRKVTREEGVALYMHYSGLWDERYCAEHPEAAILHADGTYDKNIVFPAGPYADDLMIPQLSELAEKYEVDGIWIDGDCWAAQMDYRKETLADFEKVTGISLNGQKPASPTDPYYQEYREYNRDLFRKYVRHYVDTLHQKYPHLQITSNWLFSDEMPEKVSIGVDFISGDTTPFNSLNATRYAARYLPQQNIPWDIMGMGQKYNGPGKIDLLPAHPVQIMQQAAATISMGGAFQVGLSQLFDGSLRMISLMSLKPVADFMKEREPYCFKGTVVPQAAMLVSTYDRYLEKSGLFSRGVDNSDSKRGLISLLCEAGQSLETISEHTLSEKADAYSMIVLPETVEALEKSTVDLLLNYAKNGGNLVLTGRKTCQLFADAGAPFTVEDLDDPVPTERFLAQQNDAKDQRFFTIDNTFLGGVLHPFQITPTGSHEVVAELFHDETSVRKPYAVICPFFNGNIAAIGSHIGWAYDKSSQCLHRDLMRRITEKLYTPLVKIEKACGSVDVVCLKKDEKLMVQLLNGNGNHHDMASDTEDFIPPVLDIELSIALDCPPKQLVLQPQGVVLPFTYRDTRAYTVIPRLDMHNVIEVIEK